MSNNMVNAFWGFCVVLVIATITAGVSYSNESNNRLFANLIDRGFSPLEVKCSQMSAEQLAKSSPCMVLAMEKLIPNIKNDKNGTQTY